MAEANTVAVVVADIIEVAEKLQAIRKRAKARPRAVSRLRVLDLIVPHSAEECPNQPVETVDGASPQCPHEDFIMISSCYDNYASALGAVSPKKIAGFERSACLVGSESSRP